MAEERRSEEEEEGDSEVLDLSGRDLDGSGLCEALSSLGDLRLAKVRYLYLSNNILEAEALEASDLFRRLPSLRWLDLRGNRLRGQVRLMEAHLHDNGPSSSSSPLQTLLLQENPELESLLLGGGAKLSFPNLKVVQMDPGARRIYCDGGATATVTSKDFESSPKRSGASSEETASFVSDSGVGSSVEEEDGRSNVSSATTSRAQGRPSYVSIKRYNSCSRIGKHAEFVLRVGKIEKFD